MIHDEHKQTQLRNRLADVLPSPTDQLDLEPREQRRFRKWELEGRLCGGDPGEVIVYGTALLARDSLRTVAKNPDTPLTWAQGDVDPCD